MSQLDPRYARGYIAGVFDLFHVGHLALLRQARARCQHLRVGVLTDELVIFFKQRPPVITAADRAEILAALRYVDEVVLVDHTTIDKVAAWQRWGFDCLFAGDDRAHEPGWIADAERLKALGAAVEYFGYTPGVSSTMIRRRTVEEFSPYELNS